MNTIAKALAAANRAEEKVARLKKKRDDYRYDLLNAATMYQTGDLLFFVRGMVNTQKKLEKACDIARELREVWRKLAIG